MSLKKKIEEDMKAAMRAKDQARLDPIRFLRAAIQRREVDERITLDNSQTMAVIEKLIKQSREAIEQYTRGDRQELAEKEKRDIACWQTYLPQPLSENEVDDLIAAAIAEAGASSLKDMGKVMAILKPRLQGRADMGKVSARVKSKLPAAG